MKSNLSSRDWQDLSAYLDQELNPRERSNFEKKLQIEPELRAVLADLRRTRAVLRSQPMLRAPRNFTLSPEKVGLRQPSRTYPVWGLVSALASLLFIVLLVGDFIGQRAAPAAAPAQLMNSLEAPAAAPQAFEAAPQESPNVETYPAPSAAMKAAPLPTQEPLATPDEGLATGQGGRISQDQMLATQAAETAKAGSPQIFGVDERLWRGFEVLLLIVVIVTGLVWLTNRRRI